MTDYRLGYLAAAPYDAIHVGAGASSIPTELLKQLKVGGIMVIPVGRGVQEFLRIERLHGNPMSNSTDEESLSTTTVVTGKDFKIESLMGVRYVPLVPPAPNSPKGGQDVTKKHPSSPSSSTFQNPETHITTSTTADPSNNANHQPLQSPSTKKEF